MANALNKIKIDFSKHQDVTIGELYGKSCKVTELSSLVWKFIKKHKLMKKGK